MVKEKEWLGLYYRITSFLTGHGFFREKLFSLGLEENELCACGEAQWSEHLFFIALQL